VSTATVEKHWDTGLVLDAIDLTGILRDPLPAGLGQGADPVQDLPAGLVIAGPEALKAEFLASMNALAEAHSDAPVTEAVLPWRSPIRAPARDQRILRRDRRAD
jgi:hypothetical protein